MWWEVWDNAKRLDKQGTGEEKGGKKTKNAEQRSFISRLARIAPVYTVNEGENRIVRS